MRVGTLAYATWQGLGVLAKSFYDAGVVTDVLVVEHAHHSTHWEWYPNAPTTHIRKFNTSYVEKFCNSMNVMLFFETPYAWEIIDYCRRKDIKTVLMPMYECMPKDWPAKPDLILNPSHLDQQYYPTGIHLPIPVEVDWKQRTKAETFVHNAGHGGLKGRNGTTELLMALKYIKSEARFIIRSQTNEARIGHPRIKYEGAVPWETLYSEGDVFIFPEKFNGLSLPLQEARAAGMLVMCGDRFPMNQWLPTEPLLPVSSYRKQAVSGRCVEFDEAVFDPQCIAEKIDEWYGKDIFAYSRAGRDWAETMSWESLKPKYMAVLEGLLA